MRPFPRAEDIAIVRGWARAVYRGRDRVANIHATSAGWMVELVANGQLNGPYRSEKAAARAALSMGAQQ